jgi:creatinine amidohydrolase
MPGLRAGGVRAVSANGVLGDPAGASAAEGARLLNQLAADLAAAVAAWYPETPHGQAAGAPLASEHQPDGGERR